MKHRFTMVDKRTTLTDLAVGDEFGGDDGLVDGDMLRVKHPDNLLRALALAQANLDGVEANVAPFSLPGRYIVCGRCDGSGTHVNEGIDGNGFTSDEWQEQGIEFQEDYMSGVYDVTCTVCSGKRVEFVIDDDKIADCSAESELRDLVRDHWQSEAEYAAEVAAERRMGA